MPLGSDFNADQVQVKINGSPLSEDQVQKVQRVMLESSLQIPDMIEIDVAEVEPNELDGLPFKIGAEVEVGLTSENDSITTILKGEITGLEPHISGNLIGMTVRGYDKSHRMFHGSKTNVFTNVKDSDLVSQVAGTHGLSVDAEATSEVFESVFQYAQSDFDFLAERARRIGYILYASNGKLTFKKNGQNKSADVTLEFGKDLISFRPRVMAATQIAEVKVRGWDPKKKAEIEGVASSTAINTAVGSFDAGGSMASKLGNPKAIMTRMPVNSPTDANAMAQALLDAHADALISAEGECIGNPAIHAGMTIEVKGIGTQFSGKYFLTSVRHEFQSGEYKTSFVVEGTSPATVSSLVQASKTETEQWGGVVVGVVTNNNDPENMGRVRVKFPWLASDLESWWARVMNIGAGKERGNLFMPEVEDEVLVAFEQGDFNHPVVLGGVYNGADSPPLAASKYTNGGEIIMRQIKTRTGHTITLSDESGKEYIEIKDSKTNTLIKMDTDNKKITMRSEGEIEISAMSNITIKSDSGAININASAGNVAIKAAQQFNAEGSTGVSIRSNTTASFEGTTTTVKGTASAEVSSTGNLTIRGTLVMIN